MFLLTVGLVSNTASANLGVIQGEMFLMNCPLPVYNGVATINSINGYNVNYTVAYRSALKTDFNGTSFICQVSNFNPNNPVFQVTPVIVQYGASTFWGTIPYGWLAYISDSFGVTFSKLQAMFTLIALFVTPVGFNILGYTLSSLSALGQLFVISIYGISYILIGIMLYKVISPFSGAE